MPIINTTDYTLTEIVVIIAGTMLWNFLYLIIIRNSFKLKFVEMPLVVATANLAWEFLWGFVFTTDLGLLFVWGLRIWFFLDLLIFYHVVMYGYKQLRLPLLIQYSKPIIILGTIAWGFVWYFFIKEGYDTSMGATSAYIITVMISSFYITLFLHHQPKEDFSYANAWLKLVGTGCMSAFMWLHYPEKPFLLSMTVVVTIFDIIYVYLFWQARKSDQ